jgi:hypothetical protein
LKRLAAESRVESAPKIAKRETFGYLNKQKRIGRCATFYLVWNQVILYLIRIEKLRSPLTSFHKKKAANHITTASVLQDRRFA